MVQRFRMALVSSPLYAKISEQHLSCFSLLPFSCAAMFLLPSPFYLTLQQSLLLSFKVLVKLFSPYLDEVLFVIYALIQESTSFLMVLSSQLVTQFQEIPGQLLSSRRPQWGRQVKQNFLVIACNPVAYLTSSNSHLSPYGKVEIDSH